MTDPTMDAVLSRLDALERQNRRLKRWGAGVLLLGLALGGMAMAQEEKVPEVVRARRFEVLDATGQAYVTLGRIGVTEVGIAIASPGESGARKPMGRASMVVEGEDTARVRLQTIRASAGVSASGDVASFILCSGDAFKKGGDDSKGGSVFASTYSTRAVLEVVAPDGKGNVGGVSIDDKGLGVSSSERREDGAQRYLSTVIQPTQVYIQRDGKTLFKVPE